MQLEDIKSIILDRHLLVHAVEVKKTGPASICILIIWLDKDYRGNELSYIQDTVVEVCPIGMHYVITDSHTIYLRS